DGSPWLTVCSRATTVDEQNACDTASLTLDSPPAQRSRSVLDDGQPDRSAPLVRCDWFTDKANGADPALAVRWRAKADRCHRLEAFYLARVYVRPTEQPPRGDCGITDIVCRVDKAVQDALAAGIRAGIQGLVDITVQTMAWMLGK